MSMKKRIVSLFTAAAFVISMAACSSGDTTESSAAVDDTSVAASSATESSAAASAVTDDANADWAYIEGKGEMIIGITYFEPMNYLDDAGELTGFETEFAQATCAILGVEPKFQEINWNAKETELNAKNIDCIWNGMTITEDRQANMSISQPYMANKQVLVVKSENLAAMAASVEGKNIVAEAGSAGESVAQSEEFFSTANYTPVDSQAKALMEVASGTADGCVIDYVTSIGMIGEGTDYVDLAVVEEHAFGEEQYGIAMRKEDTEFTAKVNDAINQLIADGTLAGIAEKYKLTEQLITE